MNTQPYQWKEPHGEQATACLPSVDRAWHKVEPWRRLFNTSVLLVLLISSAMLSSIHTVLGASSDTYRIEQSILKPSGGLTSSSTYRLHGSMSGELLVVPASSGNYRLSPANSEPPDQEAPVITLLGSAEMDVLFNGTFTDPGSSVSDGFESGLIATVTGSVNTAVPGTYTLSYNVSDSAGNAATEVKRMVHVVATGSFQVGGSVLKQSSGSLIPMEGVSVSLLQDGVLDTQLTDANGMYAMSINASSSLKLTAQKPHESGQASRGVDVLDIVAIRKHILVRAPFTKSIEMVAADTNLDASVDVRDIVGMRKVILVRTDAFLEDANGEKVSFWRFVASDFQSVDVSQAFAEVDAAQSIDYSSINANINDADFLAVKLGDVNDDWSAPTSSTTQNVFVEGGRPQAERLALGSPFVMEDGRVALALHANQLRGLLALQLDLHWDPEVLALDGIHSHGLKGFDASIHTGHIKGSTRIAWDDASLKGVDPDKDQSIIQLIFSRQPSVKRGSPIHVRNLILQDDGGAFRGEQTLSLIHI